MDNIDYNDPKVLDSIGTGKDGWRVPAGKRGNEELHEGAAAAESGGYHCRYFAISSGTDGFYPAAISRVKTIRNPLRMTARSLEPILAPTYGCIVYQEQVMQIVRELGGYTLGRSDLVQPCHE